VPAYNEENGLPNEVIVAIVMRLCTAQSKMLLFCTVRDFMEFELASQKKEVEKIQTKQMFLAIWQLSGSVLSQCFLCH